MVRLRPIEEGDADALFPLVHGTAVTDTLLWDGPESLEGYRASLREFAVKTAAGEMHVFTIAAEASGEPMGNLRLRTGGRQARGTVGLWIGERYHGKGYGTRAIALVVEYGFEKLDLDGIDAAIFFGNHASRRAFEKNGFTLQRTTRGAVCKRGVPRDEWLMALERDAWRRRKPG